MRGGEKGVRDLGRGKGEEKRLTGQARLRQSLDW
jgi:hypothetical protein